MGDRTMWREDCPKCKGIDTVDVYDAPSSLMFSRTCDVCNWSDGMDYYETEDNVIELLTKEEAKTRKIIK